MANILAAADPPRPSLAYIAANNSYFAFIRVSQNSSSIDISSSQRYTAKPAPLDAHQYLTRLRAILSKVVSRTKRRKVLSITLMLLLLVGFFGLFAGLVFFSEDVIEPESTS